MTLTTVLKSRHCTRESRLANALPVDSNMAALMSVSDDMVSEMLLGSAETVSHRDFD